MGQIIDISSARNAKILGVQRHNPETQLFKACEAYLTQALSTGLRDYGIRSISIKVNKTNTAVFNIFVYLKRGFCAMTEIEPVDYVFNDDAMVDLLKIFKDKVDKRLEKDSKVLPMEVH